MQRIRPDVKHIKIGDFPRTPWAVSFGLRPALQKAFNYCRQYPDKMESLKATLTFIMQKIGEWEASAKKVEFEGGSQKKPLQSGTFVTPALTTAKNGELQPFNQPERPHSDAIDRNKQDAAISEHQSAQGAWVAPHVPVQRPAHGNPLKPSMPAVQQQQLEQPAVPAQQPTQQVGHAYQATPDLAAVLAQNAQR